MRAQESINHTFVSATTYGPFPVIGGRYLLTASSTNWNSGTLDIAILQSDGSTYVTVPPFSGTHLAANGSLYYELPPGVYEFSLATTANAIVSLTRIPLE
jgi:hypothetical protein